MTNRNYIRLDAAMAMLKSKGVEHWKAIEALLDEKVIINSHEDYLEQIIHHAIELSKCEEAYGSLQTHFSAHRQQFVEREALKARMEARAINDYAVQEEKEKQEKLEEQERLQEEKEERAAELAKLPPIKDSELEQRSATYRRSKRARKTTTKKTTTKKTTKEAPANEEDGGTGEE
jgi:hypothetical protein